MQTQYEAFLEFSEYPTFKEYLQHQVDTMRISQEDANRMVSESEEEVWDLAEIFNEIELNKEEVWDLASI